MYVYPNTRPEPMPLPGIDHVTLAGQAEGLTQLSVWHQFMAPGACTPPHNHDCDEVVLCLSGEGTLHVGEEEHRFAAPCTLVLPAHRAHQIVNSGTQPLETLGLFGSTPVGTRGPDGTALALPWRS